MAQGFEASGEVLDELAERVASRRRQAEDSGDSQLAVRLRAMECVLGRKVIAVVCPDAVVVAGEAAEAAFEGRSEPEWYAEAFSRREKSEEALDQLNTAVRLLRSAQLWPWLGRLGRA